MLYSVTQTTLITLYKYAPYDTLYVHSPTIHTLLTTCQLLTHLDEFMEIFNQQQIQRKKTKQHRNEKQALRQQQTNAKS